MYLYYRKDSDKREPRVKELNFQMVIVFLAKEMI